MMIRLASAAAIAALMSTAAMAQSSSTPMTQPAPKAPMAQSAPSQMGPSAHLMMAVPANGTTVTNYYKQSVYDPSGNKVGAISDLIVEKDGRITTAMVGVGGFLGIDEKTVVVPFDAFTVSQENNQRRLTLTTTKDALKSAPGFTYDRATAAWVTDKSISTAAQKLPLLIGTQPRE
jgi:sporulation protein YlmC with PRC-barrel domain